MRSVAELHSALRNGGIRGPYILVGHAIGGDIARVFADLHMSEVAGMVLIDPAERDVETTHDMDDLWRGIDERNAAYLKFCRDTLAAGKPLYAAGGAPRLDLPQLFVSRDPRRSFLGGPERRDGQDHVDQDRYV